MTIASSRKRVRAEEIREWLYLASKIGAKPGFRTALAKRYRVSKARVTALAREMGLTRQVAKAKGIDLEDFVDVKALEAYVKGHAAWRDDAREVIRR